MEKLKLSLVQKWDVGGEYTFAHACGLLSDGRGLVLTSKAATFLIPCDESSRTQYLR